MLVGYSISAGGYLHIEEVTKMRKCGIVLGASVLVVVAVTLRLIYLYKPIQLSLREICVTETKRDAVVPAWIQLAANRKNDVHELNAEDIPPIDFSRNYLVVSFGRRVKTITYVRASQNQSGLAPGAYIGKGILTGEFNPKKAYVYVCDKVHVFNDLKSIPM